MPEDRTVGISEAGAERIDGGGIANHGDVTGDGSPLSFMLAGDRVSKEPFPRRGSDNYVVGSASES